MAPRPILDPVIRKEDQVRIVALLAEGRMHLAATFGKRLRDCGREG